MFLRRLRLSGDFRGIVALAFSKFWDGARNPYEVVRDSMTEILRKNYFCLQNWENDPNMGQKQVFLNLLKNVAINPHRICSIMKTCIIYCVSGQISYLAKNSFPEIWAKMFSANKIAGFSNEPCLQNKLMK